MCCSDYPSDPFEGHSGRPLADRLVGRLGFDRFGQHGRLPEDWSPLVSYAVVVVAFELVVLQGYRLATGQVLTFVQNPLWLLRPPVLLGAAFATGMLHRRYDRAIARSNLHVRVSESEQFDGLVPDWLSLVFILIGVSYALANAVVIITLPQLYEIGGATRVIRFLIVTPFGYVPVLASFLATYVSIEVLLPRRIKESDVRLDYLDPENLGGLRPIGELVKLAYYFLMIGLIAYALGTYGPHILGGILGYREIPEPGSIVNAAFTTVWILAVQTMAYGIYVLHQYMARQKRELLYELLMTARQNVKDPWNIRRFDALNPSTEYQRYRKRVEYVSSTREYPATFTMWSQIIVGAVIPKVLQIVLDAV